MTHGRWGCTTLADFVDRAGFRLLWLARLPSWISTGIPHIPHQSGIVGGNGGGGASRSLDDSRRIHFYLTMVVIHSTGIRMEPVVLENPLSDEYDFIVLLPSLVVIVALGALPLVLLDDGLAWSWMIWIGAISMLAVGYRLHDKRRLKFIHIGDNGIGLQLKSGDCRRYGWGQVDSITWTEGSGSALWLLLVVPFAYSKEAMGDRKEGVLSLKDGRKYRVSRDIAEAIHAAFHETTGKWLA